MKEILSTAGEVITGPVFAEHVGSYRHTGTFWKTVVLQKIRLGPPCENQSALSRILSLAASLFNVFYQCFYMCPILVFLNAPDRRTNTSVGQVTILVLAYGDFFILSNIGELHW